MRECRSVTCLWSYWFAHGS